MGVKSRLEELLDVLDGPAGWRADLLTYVAEQVAAARLDELSYISPAVSRHARTGYPTLIGSVGGRQKELRQQLTTLSDGDKE